MRLWAPCGACESYVPSATGCEHWAPGLTPKAISERARRLRQARAVVERRAMDKAASDALRQMLTPR
jgi:hypothetical protein